MVTLNKDQTVAIDRDYYWRPIATCPAGVKVQLLNPGGVAVYGKYNGKERWFSHWAPLPSMLKPGDSECVQK
jgi:hypothetical protein